MSSLASTKLRQPPPMARRIQRPSLNKLLDEGLQLNRQLTLVSAPTGYGKSIFVSEWLTVRSESCTWLSLEPMDDDPVRFFTYFVAALQNIYPNIKSPNLQIIHSEHIPPVEHIATALINGIMGVEERFIMVLDDFHVIQDRFIFDVFEQLLANPIQPLHLILITREDPPLPLARLRAHNQLTEIRAKDLRFSLSDIDAFFKEVMDISLTKADLVALESKTEGWIAGLQLAGLSIQKRTNPSSLIATLSGSHRFILSYLTEEVLNQQPKEIRQFLLQTSILNKLNPDLCNAVTGKSDGRMMLQRLLNANLFVIALDDGQNWYRYHHLFAGLLRELRGTYLKDTIPELHERASRWYAQAGMVNEAIHHALVAKDYEMTVRLLENHAMELIAQGYARTVHSWVQALPLEWRSQSPKTNLAFAWMHLLRGAYTEAGLYLERGKTIEDDSLFDEESTALKAEWLVIQALLLFMQDQTTFSMEYATQALELTPYSDDKVRGLAHYVRGSVFRTRGDFPRAIEAYQLAIQHGRTAENHIAEMWSSAGLALMGFERGQLQLAFDVASPIANRIADSPSSHPIYAIIFGIIAEIYYQWNQLDKAQHNSERTLGLCILGGNKSGMINSRTFISRIHQLSGNLDKASEEIQQAVDLLQINTPDYIRHEVLCQQVSLNLALKRHTMAEMILQAEGFLFGDSFNYPEFPSKQKLTHSNGLVYNCSLRFLLHQTQTNRQPEILNSGMSLVNKIIETTIQRQFVLLAIEALLLRARMYEMLNNATASQADVMYAIELGQPEGIIGVFVDQGLPIARILKKLTQLQTDQQLYVDRLLKAFSANQTDVKTLIDPLTDRELEVLQLMAKGLKYKEIATKLTISLNTVRYHVKGIYSKLQVDTRTRAIETARQQNII